MKNQFLLLIIPFFLISNYQTSNAQSIVASHKIKEIDSLVYIIDSEVKLINVMSDSVFIDGTSLSWNYCYRNYDVHYYFHSTFNSAIYDSSDTLIIYGPSNISKHWIDSDSALFLAEEQGGREFRNTNIHYKITASLGEPIVPDSKPFWYINYISLDNASNQLNLIIEAESDVTSVSEKINKVQPEKIILFSNYPNPFNSTTIISYQLPRVRCTHCLDSNWLSLRCISSFNYL